MAALRRRGASTEGAVTVRVDNDCLRRADGHWVAVLVTSQCDITALDEIAATRLHSTMVGLFDSVSGPIQLLVRSRPWRDGGDVGGTSSLQPLMAQHARRHLATAAPARRQVIVAVEGDSRVALSREVENTARLLGGAGMASRLVTGAALRDLFDEASWTTRPHHLETNSGLVRCAILTRFPGVDVGFDWLAPLLTLSAPGDVSIHVRPLSADDALRLLRRRLRDHTAQHMADAESGRVRDVRVDVALDNAEALRERLASNQGRAVEIAIVAAVRGRDAADLDAAWLQLRTAWSMTTGQAVPAHFRHDQGLVSVLPLCTNRLEGWKLTDSVAAATAIPWMQTVVDDPAGYRLGHDRRGGAPICLDPFATDSTSNANVAVMATSGHGKSFTVSALMIEARRRGRDVLVLDPEGEYRGLVARLGGSYVDLAPGSGSSLNIFETGSNAAETTASAIELMSMLANGVTELERSAADAAIGAALAAGRGGVIVLGDVVDRLGDVAPRLATILARHSAGAIGDLLSRPSTVNTRSPILGIGYRDVPSEFVPALTFIVAQWLWTLVREDRRQRHVVVDEVGLLLEHEPLRRLLVQLARRCRKYNASLVVATQNAADLLASPDAMVIASNAATVLLGGQRSVDVARMATAFGLTPSQQRFLESARRGEFLVLSGQRRAELVVSVPPEYAAMMLAPFP